MQRRKERGFTLVELLLVIAIIGILAAVAVPRLTKGTEAAERAACQANRQALEAAYEVFRANPPASAPTDADKVLAYLADSANQYVKHDAKCPTGGVYTLDLDAGTVTCDKHPD